MTGTGKTVLHRYLRVIAGCIAGLVQLSGVASAQTVTCSPKEFRPSLVRINGPSSQGTGVVIKKRDDHVVVLTVKHVMPFLEDFTVTFQVAPNRPVTIRSANQILLAVPPDSDLTVFRVDAAIPREVIPEDPFVGGVPEGATLLSWGYPLASGTTLCSFEARLRTLESGQLVTDGYVPEGVSGGPMFFVDPEDGAPKLAGIVARGDGEPKRGTTAAIDIRQAVTIVATSKDPRNANMAPVWPNVPLPDDLAAYNLISFRKVDRKEFVIGGDGASDQRWTGAVPVLPTYYMGLYEVTRSQYHECVTAGACTYTAANTAPRPNELSLPVVNVTWHQATAYAKWLRSHLMRRRETDRGLRRLLEAGWQIDLPSELEWEKAARKNGRDNYPWGPRPGGSDANYNTGRLRAVDSSRCKDCEYGLFDMAGNAREWTRSLKLPYPYKPEDADKRDAPGNRAIRGGSHKREENAILAERIIRSTNRQEEPPDKFDEFTGFRVALVCRKDVETPCTWQEPD